MLVSVEIPSTLREYSGDRSKIEVSASNVANALDELKSNHQSLYRCICDETGTVRPHINLFVNSDLISTRKPDGLAIQFQSDDVLTIWTAVSGG